MMSHKSQNFEILCDSPSAAGNQPPRDRQESVSPQSQPLRHLSVSQSQNRQLENSCVDDGIQRIHELRRASRNPHLGVVQKNEKRVGGRLTRPSITPNTFEVLDTVAELESQTQNVAAVTSKLSGDAHRILQLPVDQYSNHPLSIAAFNIPPLEKQLAKHRDGWFDWILAVTPPNNFKSQRDESSDVGNSTEVRKVYFGCNLLPELSPSKNGALETACSASSYSLLVTSLEITEDVLEVFRGPAYEPIMALTEEDHSTPVKTSGYASLCDVDEKTPTSTVCTRGDDTSPPSIIDSFIGDHITRIEDSFEALDILEDQLEAFDKDARFNQFIPTEKPHSAKPLTNIEIATPSLSVRFATPQPQRTFTKPGSATLRVKPASEPRRTTLRKVTSMTLDSPKFKAEEKDLIQFSPSPINKAAKSFPQRLVAKSPKKPTVPTFELPGETVARRLKEQKAARLASLRATQPTAASLRRANSVKVPTRSTFELPGEAISRRKREEHQAQLRAQEEEERKRRTFRARPLPSHVAPTTVPRETIASRARQNTATLTENSVRGSTTNRRPHMAIGSHSRPALSSTINQVQHRGRGPKAETPSVLQSSRATSTSTNSLSGKRSSLSIEDVQMQKLRGHEIYQRDNSWTDARMREKSEREALAKLAREEAAERSRQKSREWAAKQARKRMTVGSPQDVVM